MQAAGMEYRSLFFHAYRIAPLPWVWSALWSLFAAVAWNPALILATRGNSFVAACIPLRTLLHQPFHFLSMSRLLQKIAPAARASAVRRTVVAARLPMAQIGATRSMNLAVRTLTTQDTARQAVMGLADRSQTEMCPARMLSTPQAPTRCRCPALGWLIRPCALGACCWCVTVAQHDQRPRRRWSASRTHGAE